MRSEERHCQKMSERRALMRVGGYSMTSANVKSGEAIQVRRFGEVPGGSRAMV